MKIANIVFFLLFGLSAVLQYNDPDSLRWIGIYVLSSIACGVWHFRPANRRCALAVAVIVAVWIAALVPAFLSSPSPLIWAQVFDMGAMKTEAVELFREIGGLAFIAAWMAALIFSGKPKGGER